MKVCAGCGAVLVTGGGAWRVALRREDTGGEHGPATAFFEVCSVRCLLRVAEEKANGPTFQLDAEKKRKEQLKLFG